MKKRTGTIPSNLWKKVAARIAAVLVLSLVLGLAFNSSNPLGIRWSQPAQAAESGQAESVAELAGNIVAAQSVEAVSRPKPASAPPPQPALAQPNQPVPLPPFPPAPEVRATGVIPRDLPEPAPATPPPGPTPIKWPEAKALVAREGAVLIDARAGGQYEAGHIPGALSFPYNNLAREIQSFREKFPLDTVLITYCGSQSCSLSRQLAVRLFHEHGYKNVRYMTGGYQEYLQAEVSY